MQIKAISYKREKSRYGGFVFVLFFKCEDGRSARTWLYPGCGNFVRWEPVLRHLNSGNEVILDGVIIKNNNLVDADSFVRIVAVNKRIESVEHLIPPAKVAAPLIDAEAMRELDAFF